MEFLQMRQQLKIVKKKPVLQRAAGEGTRPRDGLTEIGARTQAAEIEALWTADGHSVKTTFETAIVNGSTIFMVRSNLVGGLPRR